MKTQTGYSYPSIIFFGLYIYRERERVRPGHWPNA